MADDESILAELLRLRAENERLRAVLNEIARKSTQSIDTNVGGRLLREIEVMARAALDTGAMSQATR